MNKTFEITFVDGINDGTVQSLISFISGHISNETETLLINFCSSGGLIRSALALYHYLTKLSCTVHIHNIGEVSSSAIIVYLAADKRTAEKHTKFCIHPVEFAINRDMNLSRFKECYESLKMDVDNYANIFNERTEPYKQKSIDIYKCLTDDSLSCNRDYALEIGLMTE